MYVWLLPTYSQLVSCINVCMSGSYPRKWSSDILWKQAFDKIYIEKKGTCVKE